MMKVGNLIVVIVDKYKEEVVLKRALAFGANSGVILIGRGTGDENHLKILGIKIEPEKRVVLLISKPEYTNTIVDELNKELNLEEVNQGIAFVLPIKHAIGWEI